MNTSKITPQLNNISTRKSAIIVGISLLAMAIAAIFSYGIVLVPIIKNEGAITTVDAIKSSALLFRLGILGWLLILVLDVIVAWALYHFFKRVNKNIAILTTWFRVIYTVFLATGILCLVLALSLATYPNNLEGFSTTLLNTLVEFFLNAFITIWTIGLIVFGLHLAGLSYLAIKHHAIHNTFSIFLAIAAFSYIVLSIAKIVLPTYQSQIATAESILSAPMAISEIGFAVWLLIKGGKAETNQ